MAKRKRLTLPEFPPGRESRPDRDAHSTGLETKGMFPMEIAPNAPPAPPSPGMRTAPIARIAAEAASVAALDSLASEVAAAREAGRLIQALPLDAIDAGYLMRDRMRADEEELGTLIASIRARGQQTPIEVVGLGPGRFGLISGWRRLTALGRLQAEAPADPRFATVQAILRRPETASDAYLAMVEENEIRVGISYYERARIVARAAELGVFPDPATALAQLFAAASRAKRSKIGSFLRLHAALDDRLHFPFAIPERLGLALVRALDADDALGPRLRERLRKTPAETPEAELAALERALQGGASAAVAPAADLPVVSVPRRDPQPCTASEIAPGIQMDAEMGRITLTGPGVTGLLEARLVAWLRA